MDMDVFLDMEPLVTMDMQPMDTMDIDMVAIVVDTTVNVRLTLMLMPTLSARFTTVFLCTMPMLPDILTMWES